MGYYRAGALMHTGRRYGARFTRRGGYYMAGGFWSHLKHAFHSVAHFAEHTIVGKLAMQAVETLTPIGGIMAAGGRVMSLFTPTSAPSGLPPEGTPALATTVRLATYKSASHRARLAMLAHRRRRTRRRRY